MPRYLIKRKIGHLVVGEEQFVHVVENLRKLGVVGALGVAELGLVLCNCETLIPYAASLEA